MRKVLLAAVIVAAAMLLPAAPAEAKGPCGLPDKGTLWIDFGDGSVPFWDMFAKPGNIVAAANFIYPPRIRALGAKTIYFDLNFHNRFGGPNDPATPAYTEERAQKLFDYAVASMGCERPYIALNELFGASTPTPWSPSNAQYREDVLIFLRTLAARGARPFLLISSRPYTGGDAAAWWRQAAQYADLVREVYFPAPLIYERGPILGSRTLRTEFRKAAAELLAIGIPPAKLGIMLGFQTTPGWGGRERLQPATAWFTTVKWQALAARQVARELGLGSVWSWGWGVWSQPESDPDKPAAACVWLWTRSPKLCNGPAVAGPKFDASKTEGQINFTRGIQCRLDRRGLSAFALAGLTAVTGDRDAAYTALFERLAGSTAVSIPNARIRAAERAIVSSRFGGSFASYRAALARAHASPALARGVIGDELRRVAVERGIRVPEPSGQDVSDYYDSYGSADAREVIVKPAPWWLGGRHRGIALSSSAPASLFRLATGRTVRITTPTGRYRVRAVGATRPLSSIGLAAARPSIAAALRELARQDRYDRWAVGRETKALARTMCQRDELPDVGAVDLTDYLPFLAAQG